MAHPPSYEEAVTGGHWLDLVAPYVAPRDYSRLCQVSRRFYDQFAPRLWNDPLQTARLLGLHPNDDLQWFIFFATRHAMTVRNSTRRLVVSLDFRDFAVDMPMSIAGNSGRSFSETLRLLGTAFPAVRCILLGGNTGYDPSDLGHLLNPNDYPEDGSVPMPLILDIACCGMPLPNTFFHPSYWRQLVYLDMSNVPGSLKGIIKTGTFNQGALPHLRILKLRGRVLDDVSLAPIAEHATQRIWSLDLTNNKLTDSSVHTFFHQCFGTDDLTAETSHYEVEGKLAVVGDVPGETIPSVWRGWLSYIVESAASGTFSHPDRYLADAPVYNADNHGPPSIARLAGNEPLRSDRAKDVKLALAGGPGKMPLDWHHVRDIDICKLPASLTHLYLSGNRDFTVEGVESIFRCSRGHIQHFDCASPTIPTGGLVPFTLTGILGRSHLFRPVMASNLRSLRIHHSLVTQIPTLSDPSRSPREALMYAETVLRERAETAYPLMIAVLGPDWNSRLQSLTLAGLPRISAGPLIDKLIRFLVSAAEQEAAVRAQQAAGSLSRHGPAVLSGLRHLRLEFEPYPPQDGDLDGAFDSLDAKALLNANSSDAFSFFRETRTAATTAAWTEAAAKKSYQLINVSLSKDGERTAAGGDGGRGIGYGDKNIGGTNTNVPRHSDCSGAGGSASPDHLHSKEGTDNVAQARQSDRLLHYPLSGALDASSEYVRELLFLGDNSQTAINTTADNRTNAQRTIQLSVWVGSGQPGSNRAINSYMANLARRSLRANIRPATPDQVAAGVPVGACVYNAAWDAIAWLPAPDESKPQLATAATSGVVNADRHRLESAVRPRRHPKDGVMVDVVDAIRQFRAETRSGKRNPGGWALQDLQQDGRKYEENQQPVPRHWAGSLEILLAS